MKSAAILDVDSSDNIDYQHGRKMQYSVAGRHLQEFKELYKIQFFY